MFAHCLRQHFRRDRAAALIDIETVRLHAERNHFCAEFMEDVWRNMIGRAMRAIDHQSEGAQSSARCNCVSMARSTSSGSLLPSAEKNLIPLSSYGLCEALMTTPAERRSVRVR